MKFRPLGDRVLVHLDPLPEKSDGGIILPGDSAGERIRTATVVRVGPGRWVDHHRLPVGVEPGEKVAFLRWHLEHQTGKAILGVLHSIGEDLGLIRADDILFSWSAHERHRVV